MKNKTENCQHRIAVQDVSSKRLSKQKSEHEALSLKILGEKAKNSIARRQFRAVTFLLKPLEQLYKMAKLERNISQFDPVF